jgi:hypothetical protein
MKIIVAFALAFLAPLVSQATTSLPSQLQGTAWEGSYEAIDTNNQIKIVFMNELNASGGVQYFHTLGNGVVNFLIRHFDGGCPNTPRSLNLNADSKSGEISVYSCEDNVENELALEASAGREAKQTIEVRQINASQSRLDILVSIAGIPVTYSLHRAQADLSVFSSRAAIQAWLSKK